MVKKSSAVLACVIVGLCAVLVTASLLSGGFIIYQARTGQWNRSPQLSPGATEAPSKPVDYTRLDEIRAILHQKALTDVPDEDLLVGAAKGMVVGTGDIYANYFTAEEFQQYHNDEQGSYVGIGASVNIATDDLITVVNVYRNSPAEKGGMRPGDKLIAVDDTDVTAMSLEDTVKLVKGEPNTQVRVTVLRQGEQLELMLTRAEVLADRTEWRMIEDNIGYIKIIEFNGNAATLFEKAVHELRRDGAKGFVLDLRNNPGGSYDIVVQIADMLFPSGPIIALEDKNGKKNSIANSDPSYLNMPLVTLINENSASASELLSGGIQDYEVGILVGVTTYGKGVAQDFYQFSDGSALKYTSHRYLTGGGRCPEDVGISPDIEIELDEAVVNDAFLLATAQDNQYMRAIEEVKKLIQ